jgi:hypothetical protein
LWRKTVIIIDQVNYNIKNDKIIELGNELQTNITNIFKKYTKNNILSYIFYKNNEKINEAENQIQNLLYLILSKRFNIYPLIIYIILII